MIERATTPEQVRQAAHLFDEPVSDEAATRFLHDPIHHLLLAREGDRVVGFVSGVETTHPDKGTEMFLYELEVEPAARRQGHGRALVEALASLARDRGCYAMWVLTDADNDAALATYTSGGAGPATSHVMLTWDLAAGSR